MVTICRSDYEEHTDPAEREGRNKNPPLQHARSRYHILLRHLLGWDFVVLRKDRQGRDL